jgi:signal transduction histidine kinase
VDAARDNARIRLLRLIAYGLLLALVFIFCLAAFRIALPVPPAQMRLDHGQMRLGEGAWQPAVLPYVGPGRGTQTVFRLDFDRPAGDHALWSVFLPRLLSQAEVSVNGTIVFDNANEVSRVRPDRNIPEIAAIPAIVLEDGRNQLTLTLSVEGPLNAFLDPLYVGPDAALRPPYNLRIFCFVTLPIVLAAWQAIVSVGLAAIWFSRRKEPAFGVLALGMAAGVLQGFIGMLSPQFPLPFLGALPALEAVLMLLFHALYLGYRLPRAYPLLFVPPVAVALCGFLPASAVTRAVYLALGPPMIGVCLVVTALLLVQSALRGNRTALYLGPPLVIVLTCWGHDILRLLDIVHGDRIFIGRLSYVTMLVAIGTGIAWRFIQALNEVDSFAGRLVERIADAEERLRQSFVRDEARARAEALAAERTRLMRDLHDGLGGHLVSIVALSEQAGQDRARIGEAARAALKDLRLVIDAMDDIGGDLMLVLGSWRERTTAQLRAHQMKLDWQVRGSGIPPIADLRPWHVIQVLRLLDEAVTNAVKHSGARTVKVTVETVYAEGEAPTGQISVEDDGRGFDLADDAPAARKAGRGLLNMRRRAELCGARLTIVSTAGGTSVRLDLPSRFPPMASGPA